jgi:hypothetical protein
VQRLLAVDDERRPELVRERSGGDAADGELAVNDLGADGEDVYRAAPTRST